jgi:hypothetical protein
MRARFLVLDEMIKGLTKGKRGRRCAKVSRSLDDTLSKMDTVDSHARALRSDLRTVLRARCSLCPARCRSPLEEELRAAE